MINQYLTLADWRRQVAEMYAEVRRNNNSAAAWREFCARRNRLFAEHPQTPLSANQRAEFHGLRYFDYNPAWRFVGQVETDVTPDTREILLPADGAFRMSRAARVHFLVQGQAAALSLFWIEGYGGGLFLPFRDATNNVSTYGGGRYLIDGIKGADLSPSADEVILDFNFAYNPSCAYNNQWVCPLSPPENRLPFAVEAGEKKFV
ncbi:MAG: DUF1684 domain-containing protein [Chloroflexi bacterium]|nr:MAG: DUF1684 domain-containing protein [Chloroflexota bacterium]